MKRIWEMPKAELQRFNANEYISSCWGVSCSVDAANAYERGIGASNAVSHTWDHCGTASNQVIRDNADGSAYSMTEIGTDGLGNLACTVYSGASYGTPISISAVSPGMTIYWTTSASDGRTWHHQGTVHAADVDRPNHS